MKGRQRNEHIQSQKKKVRQRKNKMQKIKDTQKEKKVKSVQSITGNYPVGDFLNRLKNAGLAGKKIVKVPSTNLIKAVAKTLMEERYVEEMESNKEMLTVQLAFRKKEPLLTKVRLV